MREMADTIAVVKIVCRALQCDGVSSVDRILAWNAQCTIERGGRVIDGRIESEGSKFRDNLEREAHALFIQG